MLLRVFTGGSWLSGGSKTGGISFRNLGRLGSVHSSDVFADGGRAIWVLMGKSRFLRTRLQFMDKYVRVMAAQPLFNL